MKLYERYERDFDRTAHLYPEELALKKYTECVEKLNKVSWVDNFPSDIPFVQGLARSMAKRLGFNLWKTFPKTY